MALFQAVTIFPYVYRWVVALQLLTSNVLANPPLKMKTNLSYSEAGNETLQLKMNRC